MDDIETRSGRPEGGSGGKPESKLEPERERREQDAGGGAGAGRSAERDAWVDLLKQAGKTLTSALLTTGGLIGFVAFAGSVIVWARFYAAQVPPDQAVAAFPRGELIAIASAVLLVFAFGGLIATTTFYLIDPKGQRSRPMSRALLVLLAAEGILAIVLAKASSWQSTVVACELFLLPVFGAFWATYMYEAAGDRGRRTRVPHSRRWLAAVSMTLLVACIGFGLWVFAGLPSLGATMVGFAAIALVPTLALTPLRRNVKETELREEFLDKGPRLTLRRRLRVTVAFTVLIAVGVGLILWRVFGLPKLDVAMVGLAAIALVPTLVLTPLWLDEDRAGEETENETGVPLFTRKGVVLVIVLLPATAIGPLVVVEQAWLLAPLLVGAFLVMGLWRVAKIADGKFRWFGLAVFVSVLLFGTVTGMARNFAEPQVQPVALIRKADGPDEAIQGLYVTEADDRIYFATAATEGCSDNFVPHSGRLLWVPKSEVVAMSIGPLQSVDNAAKTALEMSYALTPAVETPAGDHVSLTVAEKQSEGEETEGEPPGARPRRLEVSGAAVAPNFGAGLNLSPENASAGDVVTLRMSKPDRGAGVRGFGQSREGRTLRLGGIPVDVLKEQARDPWAAEYVETGEGRILQLAKHRVYVEQGDGYAEVSKGAIDPGQSLYVRVTDGAVIDVEDHGLATEDHLQVEGGGSTPARLVFGADHKKDLPPEVTLTIGGTVPLKPRLLRQAWDEDAISFRVPANATTGPVSVECEQLAGQPLLRVEEPPLARISVHADPGSEQVVFDSRRSSDAHSEIVSRRWQLDGLRGGPRKRLAVDLPPRLQSYRVRLTVTDASGQVGSTELHMLRLPADLVNLDRNEEPLNPVAIAKAKSALQRAISAESTSVIEFDSRPGGSPVAKADSAIALREAVAVGHELLRPRKAKLTPAIGGLDGLTVRTLAYGSRCPAEASAQEARFDVFVLTEGVQMVNTLDCPPAGRKTTHRLLAVP